MQFGMLMPIDRRADPRGRMRGHGDARPRPGRSVDRTEENASQRRHRVRHVVWDVERWGWQHVRRQDVPAVGRSSGRRRAWRDVAGIPADLSRSRSGAGRRTVEVRGGRHRSHFERGARLCRILGADAVRNSQGWTGSGDPREPIARPLGTRQAPPRRSPLARPVVYLRLRWACSCDGSGPALDSRRCQSMPARHQRKPGSIRALSSARVRSR